jgi:hypothetical protein
MLNVFRRDPTRSLKARTKPWVFGAAAFGLTFGGWLWCVLFFRAPPAWWNSLTVFIVVYLIAVALSLRGIRSIVGIIALTFALWSLGMVYIKWSGWPFQYFHSQMTAGRVYMDSLTEKDFQVWADRTKKLLAEYEPGNGPIGVYGSGSDAKRIPADLAQLKIIRIDMSEDNVSYVWLGGLDHTELQVHRLKDDSFEFVAQYNDENIKVIWPKQ